MRNFAVMISIGFLALSAMAADQKGKAPATPGAAAKPAVVDSVAAKRLPIRNKANKIVTLETNFGKMVLELFHDVAPAHADSFVARTNAGFYNGTIFHRVIDGFMIQGGDPEGTGRGGAGYTLKAEFSDLPHVEGTLSMARSPDVNSASSQFFVCLAKAPHLDRQYTIFGQLLKGYDVLHAIGRVPTGQSSRPLKEVVLVKAYLSDAEGNAPAGPPSGKKD
jgi:cyclophilin family peptidyl-prolyl cis-trans isomerase